MTSYLQPKIYVAGHRGMEDSVTVRNLEAKGFANSVARIQVALHGDVEKYGCLSIFSEAGYILKDLQGDAIDPTDFVSDEFIAIPR